MPPIAHVRVRGEGTDGGGRDGIIGRSTAMVALRRLIARVAPTDTTVLIRGERGTGKELVARALQRASHRREGPFVAVNCAALPADLLAAELFGHERGAFTGALNRHSGLVMAAHGGTLFLDEIGDLSLQGQAMLLRFLQEREVRPVGSTLTTSVDVRVMAATNRDLERAVTEGTFRADLLDRITEIMLVVPPLRERSDDVPLLVGHFVAMANRQHHRAVQGVTAEAAAMLRAASWPGNVRQLQHAVTRAVVVAGGPRLRPSSFGMTIARGANLPGRVAPGIAGAGVTARQEQILALAHRGTALRRSEIIGWLGVSTETTRREVGELVRRGLLRREGAGAATRYAAT